MKKNISKLFLAGFLTVGFLVFPIAVIGGLDSPPNGFPTSDAEFDLATFLLTIAEWVLWIVIVIAFIFIVLAGYTFITAGGDPERVNRARSQLIYALIGVAVALLAWALIGWVATFLGVNIN